MSTPVVTPPLPSENATPHRPSVVDTAHPDTTTSHLATRAELSDWQRRCRALQWRTVAVGCVGTVLGGWGMGLWSQAAHHLLRPLAWSRSAVDVPWRLIQTGDWPLIDVVCVGGGLLTLLLWGLYRQTDWVQGAWVWVAGWLTVLALSLGLSMVDVGYNTRRFGVWPSELERDIERSHRSDPGVSSSVLSFLKEVPPPAVGMDGTQWAAIEFERLRHDVNRWLAAQYVLAQLGTQDPTGAGSALSAYQRLLWALDGYLLHLSERPERAADQPQHPAQAIGGDLHLSVLRTLAQTHAPSQTMPPWLLTTHAQATQTPSRRGGLLLGASLALLALGGGLGALAWQMQARAGRITLTLYGLEQSDAVDRMLKKQPA